MRSISFERTFGLVFLTIVCAAAAGLVGCQQMTSALELDMRGQPVTERLHMHEGTTWTMEPAEVAPVTSNEPCTKMDFLTLAGRVYDGMSQETKPADVAPGNNAEGIKQSEPPPCDESEAVKHKYVYGKQLSLTPGNLDSGDGLHVDLALVNQTLNCQSQPKAPDPEHPEKVQRDYWHCADPVDDVSSTVVLNTPALKQCVRLWSSQGGNPIFANLVGTLDDRFCIFVSVLETRKCGPPCNLADQQKAQPTNINRDSIAVDVIDLLGGPVTAGVIVGGPRPQFRTRPTGDSTPVAAPTK